jgi:hypothetical protein
MQTRATSTIRAFHSCEACAQLKGQVRQVGFR